MKDKVTLEDFNKAINEAKEDKKESFEFTDIDGNTQSVEFINGINKDLENIEEAKRYYSQKTLEAISEIPNKYPKKTNGVITAISNASKELIAQRKVLGQGLVIGFMVATGLAAIGKSDLVPENTFGGSLLKEIGFEIDYVPVANDVTDYVAASINRAIKHYEESKGTNEISRIASFNDSAKVEFTNKEKEDIYKFEEMQKEYQGAYEKTDDTYGMTQNQIDALNVVYGNPEVKKQIAEYAEKDSDAILKENLQFNNEQLEQIHSFENSMEEYQEAGRSK